MFGKRREAKDGQQGIALQEGSAPCSFAHCAARTGLSCEYVDRRGRACTTAWCPAHRIIVDGHVYCRRHAGIIAAIPKHVAGSGHAQPLPDLENRAPSLANWVADDCDADIRSLLVHEAQALNGGEVVVDPLIITYSGMDRSRVWERVWKLVEHTGMIYRISIAVEEELDAEVIIKVNQTSVYRAIPPWIGQRLLQRPIRPEVDAQRRKEFHDKIIGYVSRGIARERELRNRFEHA